MRRLEKKSRSQHAYVFLVTGLSAAQRRINTHICTNSAARTTAEYCDEGAGWPQPHL